MTKAQNITFSELVLAWKMMPQAPAARVRGGWAHGYQVLRSGIDNLFSLLSTNAAPTRLPRKAAGCHRRCRHTSPASCLTGAFAALLSPHNP